MSNPVGLEPCNLLADLPVIDSRLVQSYPELAEVASVIARNSELFASRVRTALAERGVREVADILAEPAHEKIIGDVGAPIEVMRHWLGVTLPIRHIGGDNKSVISPIPLAVPFLGIKLLRDLAE